MPARVQFPLIGSARWAGTCSCLLIKLRNLKMATASCSKGKAGNSQMIRTIARSRNRSIIDSPDLQMTSNQSRWVDYHLVHRYMEFMRDPDGFFEGTLGTEPYSGKEFSLAWKLLNYEEEQIEEFLDSIYDEDEDEDEMEEGLLKSSNSKKKKETQDTFKRPNLASYERFKKAKMKSSVTLVVGSGQQPEVASSVGG